MAVGSRKSNMLLPGGASRTTGFPAYSTKPVRLASVGVAAQSMLLPLAGRQLYSSLTRPPMTEREPSQAPWALYVSLGSSATPSWRHETRSGEERWYQRMAVSPRVGSLCWWKRW